MEAAAQTFDFILSSTFAIAEFIYTLLSNVLLFYEHPETLYIRAKMFIEALDVVINVFGYISAVLLLLSILIIRAYVFYRVVRRMLMMTMAVIIIYEELRPHEMLQYSLKITFQKYVVAMAWCILEIITELLLLTRITRKARKNAMRNFSEQIKYLKGSGLISVQETNPVSKHYSAMD